MIRTVAIPTNGNRLGCAPGADCCAECRQASPAELETPITPAAYIGAGIGLLILMHALTKGKR